MRRAAAASPPDTKCTLERSEVAGRVRDWQSLFGHVVARSVVDRGLRLEFDEAASMVELARLVAAEQSCCRFLDFAITVDRGGVGLEVRAPAHAQSIVHSLFGGA